MIESPFKTITEFKLSDLNKKFGRLVYTQSGDSDWAEGNFTNQLWFMDTDRNMYLSR